MGRSRRSVVSLTGSQAGLVLLRAQEPVKFTEGPPFLPIRLNEVKMPRPELYPVKKVVRFDQTMIDAVEKWRSKQRPVPNLPEAIRRLVELSLQSSEPLRAPSKKAAARASKMAGEEIDRLSQQSATPEEREIRKRRLLKGPKEFRDIRDRPKAKG
jgi:hypothetical protein